MPKKLNFLGGKQNYDSKTGEYESSLVGPNGKVVKDADGDGISHESKKELTFEKAVKSADNDVLDKTFGKDTAERKLAGAIKEQDFNDPSERESLKTEKTTYAPFKLDKKKYSDVEETPYGFIYNVGKQSITDLAEQERAFGSKFDPNKKYGFSRTTDSGDEVVHDTFEEAYNAVKGESEIKHDEIVYPKGTSKEYTEKVNAEFEKALPILEKYGIKLEDFGGRTNDRGGYEDNSKEIMDKYVFEPFRKKYPSGNNDAWNKEYQPIYDAIESVLDKNYNDWYIKKAPHGY